MAKKERTVLQDNADRMAELTTYEAEVKAELAEADEGVKHAEVALSKARRAQAELQVVAHGISRQIDMLATEIDLIVGERRTGPVMGRVGTDCPY